MSALSTSCFRADDGRKRQFDQIIGQSAALEAALEKVELVAPTASTVLIQGETGTGKELVAKAIHNISPRYDRAFPDYAFVLIFDPWMGAKPWWISRPFGGSWTVPN